MRSHLVPIIPGVQFGEEKMESNQGQCRSFGEVNRGFAIIMSRILKFKLKFYATILTYIHRIIIFKADYFCIVKGKMERKICPTTVVFF